VKRLLIAYDGSVPVQQIIAYARSLDLPNATEALVLCVADIWVPSLPDPAPLDPTLLESRARARDLIDAAGRTAVKAKIQLAAAFPHWNITAAASNGPPAATIASQARAWKADLILVGSRKRSRAARLLRGSVSHTLARIASCPVHRTEDPSPIAQHTARTAVTV